MTVSPQEIYEPIGDYWLCAGECGQWKRGTAAAHNGSGYVCESCEQSRLASERVRLTGLRAGEC